MQWFAFRLLRDTRSSAIAERPARRCSSAHAKYSVSHHMIIKQFLLRFASFGNQTIPSTRPVAAIQISTVGVINSCRRRSKSLYDTLWRPVHTSNIVEATFDFVATNGNNVERFYCKISSFRQSRILLQHCCRYRQHCCQKRQRCRSNIRHCRKNRSTCSIRQCCLDIVAGVDAA